jgi:hypothetical protein
MFAIKHLCLSGSSSPLRTSNFSWFETSLLRLVYLLPRLQMYPTKEKSASTTQPCCDESMGNKVYSEHVSILEVHQQLVPRIDQ